MNIRELILDALPPYDWCADDDHPIHTLGDYRFGLGETFIYDEEAVEEADEELLREVYEEILKYNRKQNIKKCMEYIVKGL